MSTFMFLLSHQFPRGPAERMEPEAWVNALLGRVFWDFLGEKYWANMVSKKIQMKLSKIRVGSAELAFLPRRQHKCTFFNSCYKFKQWTLTGGQWQNGNLFTQKLILA